MEDDRPYEPWVPAVGDEVICHPGLEVKTKVCGCDVNLEFTAFLKDCVMTVVEVWEPSDMPLRACSSCKKIETHPIGAFRFVVGYYEYEGRSMRAWCASAWELEPVTSGYKKSRRGDRHDLRAHGRNRDQDSGFGGQDREGGAAQDRLVLWQR
jgi:hypothetical protein